MHRAQVVSPGIEMILAVDVAASNRVELFQRQSDVREGGGVSRETLPLGQIAFYLLLPRQRTKESLPSVHSIAAVVPATDAQASWDTLVLPSFFRTL